MTMKQTIMRRALVGLPIGIALGYAITIAISLCQNQGMYVAAVPELIAQCGSETAAVGLQFVLCALLGAACGAGSVVWEIERWSLTKQTVVHLILLSLSMLPIAYFTHWMEHSLAGVLTYAGIFIGAYLVIWLALYAAIKRKLKAVNAHIRSQR